MRFAKHVKCQFLTSKAPQNEHVSFYTEYQSCAHI